MAGKLTRLEAHGDAGRGVVEGAAVAEVDPNIGGDPVAALARLPEVVELNIGHFLIGEAIFGGLFAAVRRMRALMDEARAQASERLTA